MKELQKRRKQQRWKGILLVFLGSVLFSSKAVLVKLIYRHELDALSTLVLRMLFAFPFFFFIAIWSFQKKDAPKLSRQDWIQIGALGVLGYYLASLFDFLGLQYISAGLERLILFVYPTIVVLMVAFFQKKPIRKTQIWALLLTYLGILIAFIGEVNFAQSSNISLGVALIFLCGLCFAGFIYGSGQIIPKLGPIRFTALAMCFACLAIIFHYFCFHTVDLLNYDSAVYQLAFVMAVLATVIPTFCFSESIRLIGPGDMAIVASVGPISTLILAFFFLGDPITIWQITGLICILFGVWKIKEKVD